MPTALKTRPRPRARKHMPIAANGGSRIANLRPRPLYPELDDHPMVAVYAVSSVLIVVGVVLLSV
jgi:hypothetical protein